MSLVSAGNLTSFLRKSDCSLLTTLIQLLQLLLFLKGKMKIKQVMKLTFQTINCVEGIHIFYAMNFTVRILH